MRKQWCIFCFISIFQTGPPYRAKNIVFLDLYQIHKIVSETLSIVLKEYFHFFHHCQVTVISSNPLTADCHSDQSKILQNSLKVHWNPAPYVFIWKLSSSTFKWIPMLQSLMTSQIFKTVCLRYVIVTGSQRVKCFISAPTSPISGPFHFLLTSHSWWHWLWVRIYD